VYVEDYPICVLGSGHKNHRANAAHIVRCVNEREGLLNLLKEALANLSGVYDGDGYTDCNGDRNHELIERLTQFLAQAEQEAP
jgi:hypothetical protein